METSGQRASALRAASIDTGAGHAAWLAQCERFGGQCRSLVFPTDIAENQPLQRISPWTGHAAVTCTGSAKPPPRIGEESYDDLSLHFSPQPARST